MKAIVLAIVMTPFLAQASDFFTVRALASEPSAVILKYTYDHTQKYDNAQPERHVSLTLSADGAVVYVSSSGYKDSFNAGDTTAIQKMISGLSMEAKVENTYHGGCLASITDTQVNYSAVIDDKDLLFAAKGGSACYQGFLVDDKHRSGYAEAHELKNIIDGLVALEAAKEKAVSGENQTQGDEE
jgi:hypothetical protein